MSCTAATVTFGKGEYDGAPLESLMFADLSVSLSLFYTSAPLAMCRYVCSASGLSSTVEAPHSFVHVDVQFRDEIHQDHLPVIHLEYSSSLYFAHMPQNHTI